MFNLLNITFQWQYLFDNLICNCTQITYPPDCIRDCIWVDDQCTKVTVCEAVQNPYTCNSSLNCVWIDSCVPFNGCGNYRFKDPKECDFIGCFPGISDNQGNTLCSSVPNYTMCYRLLTEETCQFKSQSDGEQCVWIDGKCKSVVFNYCWDLNGITTTECNPSQFCIRYADDCYLVECGLVTRREDCGSYVYYQDPFDSVYSGAANEVRYCKWDERTDLCVDANNTIFTKDTCYMETLGTSTWVESKNECVNCMQMNAFMMLIYLMILILLI